MLVLLISTFLCSACSKKRSPVTKNAMLFDTVISITLYENNSSEWIDKCFELATEYDNLFSKTNESSDVYRVNSSAGDWVDIDPATIELISIALSYEAYSDGKFSIMCGALTDLWDIKNRTAPPTDSEIKSAMKLCGSNLLDVDVESCRVHINTVGAKLDLGAVAKGYIADKIREYLEDNGIHDGIISLGGNVLVFGKNPNSETGDFTIGITEPFSNEGSVVTAVSLPSGSVVTSGNYQRYFEYNGQLYHHIIDLTTGHPADTNLNSVSIVCEKSCDADCLSTICFLLGKDDAIKLLDELNQTSGHTTGQASDSNSNTTQNTKTAYQAILIDRNNNIIYDSTK